MRKSIALIAFMCACATPRAEQALPEKMSYDVSAQTVRDAVLATLGDMKLEAAMSDDATGVIRSARQAFKGHPVALYMNCGEDPLLGLYTSRPGFKAEYLLNVRLGSDSAGTSLLVRASFFGRTNGRRHACVSLGKVEREFIETLQARLGSTY